MAWGLWFVYHDIVRYWWENSFIGAMIAHLTLEVLGVELG